MNKADRAELARAVTLIEEAKVIVETIGDAEQEKFDNMSEGLQATERGRKMEDAASAYTAPHWTDNAPSPVFESRIDATGPRGNIFYILGTARKLLAEIGVPRDRIERLTEEVTAAGNYDEAVALVQRWFAVDRGEWTVGIHFI